MASIPYTTINILLEATESCNLRCQYCFHADEGYHAGVMDLDTYRKVCDLVFPRYEQIQMLWHGGEPFCAGLDFHKKVMDIQKEYSEKYKVKVVNSIQTNGTLVDEEAARFLADNDFTVGVSFDGVTNSITRGRTEDTLRGIENLRKMGIQNLGAITVVSGANIDCLPETYALMKELNLSTDYNSLIMTGGAANHSELGMDLDHFVNKMIAFFDLWFHDTSCSIVINPFWSYVKDICYHTGSICWRTSCLGRWINVKPDGQIYPCSREFTSDYSYGRIQDVDDIDQLFESDGFLKLLENTIIRREKCQESCPWYDYCQGGCSCNALTESGIENNGGFTCLAFQKIFSYIFNQVSEAKALGKDYIKSKLNPTITSFLLHICDTIQS